MKNCCLHLLQHFNKVNIHLNEKSIALTLFSLAILQLTLTSSAACSFFANGVLWMPNFSTFSPKFIYNMFEKSEANETNSTHWSNLMGICWDFPWNFTQLMDANFHEMENNNHTIFCDTFFSRVQKSHIANGKFKNRQIDSIEFNLLSSWVLILIFSFTKKKKKKLSRKRSTETVSPLSWSNSRVMKLFHITRLTFGCVWQQFCVWDENCGARATFTSSKQYNHPVWMNDDVDTDGWRFTWIVSGLHAVPKWRIIFLEFTLAYGQSVIGGRRQGVRNTPKIFSLDWLG